MQQWYKMHTNNDSEYGREEKAKNREEDTEDQN